MADALVFAHATGSLSGSSGQGGAKKNSGGGSSTRSGTLEYLTRGEEGGDGGMSNVNLVLHRSGHVSIGTEIASAELTVAGSIEAASLMVGADDRFVGSTARIDRALEKVSQLNGVYFNWASNDVGSSKSTSSAIRQRKLPMGNHLGLMAQQVEAVVPEVVGTSSTGFKSIAYGPLVALLVEATKEQMNHTAQHDGMMTELKGLVATAGGDRDALKTRASAVDEQVQDMETKLEAMHAVVERQSTDMQAQMLLIAKLTTQIKQQAATLSAAQGAIEVRVVLRVRSIAYT
jgi:hypothetical protein